MFLGPTRRLRMRWQSFTVTTTSGFSGKTRHNWQRCWCKRFKSLRGLLFPPIQVHQARQHERVQQVVAEVIIMCHLTPIAKEQFLKVYFCILSWNLMYVLLKNLTRFNVGEDCPVFDGLYEFCQLSSGGSVASAVKLNKQVGFWKFCNLRGLLLSCPQTAFFLVLEVHLLCNVCLVNRLCFYCSRVCCSGCGHCNQLGGRTPSRQEERSLRLLLCQRHCPRHPWTAQVPPGNLYPLRRVG